MNHPAMSPLKRWRLKKGLSQDAAGRLVPAGQSDWSRWEKLLVRPHRDVAIKLRKITGLTMDRLYGIEVRKRPRRKRRRA